MQQHQIFRGALLAVLVHASALGATADSMLDDSPLVTRVSDAAQVLVWDRGFSSGACWFLAYDSDQVVDLGCGLAGMHQVSAVVPSPDRRWLAVLSAGEGHPLLEIVDLQDLLIGQGYRVVTEINPYPGTINVMRWTKDSLIVTSDMALHQFPLPDGDPTTYMFSAQRRFALEVDTWQVRPSRAER